MALPQIDVPLYDVQLISIEGKVTYRPFLVKEKKILMAASESSNEDAAILAVKQIITNCTFGKLDVDRLALFEIQYLFLKIRSKSIGEVADFKFKCPNCAAYVHSKINFDEIKINKNPNHQNKIMINDSVGMVLKYPGISVQTLPKDIKPEDLDIKILINCIDYIFDQNQIYYSKDCTNQELEGFVENLTEVQYKKIEEFFETIPSLSHSIKYKCKECNHVGDYKVDDFYSFFS
jgi:hypothetical protein